MQMSEKPVVWTIVLYYVFTHKPNVKHVANLKNKNNEQIDPITLPEQVLREAQA